MKVVFATSFHYPGHPAQFRHGLIMAREYARLLGDQFHYLALFDRDGELAGIPHTTFLHPFFRTMRRVRLLTVYLFVRYIGFFALRKKWRRSVVITQESKIAFLMLCLRPFFGFRIIYECHGLHSPLSDKIVCESVDAVVFVTERTKHDAEKWNLPTHIVLPNAVDVHLYDEVREHATMDLRRELGLPEKATLVGYIGRFYAMGEDKGIEAGLRAAAAIDDPSVIFCFVGGTPDEVRQFEGRARELGVAERVLFVPYLRDARRVAEYTRAMDVLFYAPPRTKFFMEETSPMKLYEYMAAEKPIVLSDFPALREMLAEDEVYFFQHDLAEAIRRAIQDPEAEMRASRARERVRENSWSRRADQILSLARTLV